MTGQAGLCGANKAIFEPLTRISPLRFIDVPA
jgi:hypothetical protein